jgi:hypothetical protein
MGHLALPERYLKGPDGTFMERTRGTERWMQRTQLFIAVLHPGRLEPCFHSNGNVMRRWRAHRSAG